MTETLRLSTTRGQAVALALIVLAIAAGGLARARTIGSNTHVSADENGYVANANRMLSGKRYATFKWPPGTSLAFALVTRLSGHRSLRLTTHARGPAQAMQLLLGVLALALVAAFAWLVAGPWPALAATALVASYEPLIEATRTFLSEPAGAFLLLAAVGAAALARRRFGASGELRWIAVAGVLGGLACLTRGDLAVGVAAIAVALGLAGRDDRRDGPQAARRADRQTDREIDRPADQRSDRQTDRGVAQRSGRQTHRRADRRRGGVRAAIYLGAVLATLAPWLAYASSVEGRFVPITTAGPDAFFVGSYLPGKGLLVPTEEQLAPEVCRHFPRDCGRYWQHSSLPLFQLIQARHPGMSENAAVDAENLRNIRRYALGKPAAFASMLWGKFWKMWTNVWSGGNGTYHPATSQTQHLIYLWLAWVGLLAGAILTRRFALLSSAAVLLSVSALATLFNDQPRYNVSLMALLLSAGVAGWWLAAERLLGLYRERARANPERTYSAVASKASAKPT